MAGLITKLPNRTVRRPCTPPASLPDPLARSSISTAIARPVSRPAAAASPSRSSGGISSSSSSNNILLHSSRPHGMRTQAATSAGAIGTAGAPAAASTAGASAATGPSTSGLAVPVLDDFATDQRPIILFDGVCNLCNGGVNFMLDNDPKGVFRLAALQSPAGRRLLVRCGRRPDDISSIVLVERDRHYIRSEAILRIGVALRVPLPLLAAFGFPVPLPLRDVFYDTVANSRYSFFGRTDACRLGDAGKFADRFITD